MILATLFHISYVDFPRFFKYPFEDPPSPNKVRVGLVYDFKWLANILAPTKKKTEMTPLWVNVVFWKTKPPKSTKFASMNRENVGYLIIVNR